MSLTMTKKTVQPRGLGPTYKKGLKKKYSLIKNNFMPPYHTLQTTDPITKYSAITVWPTYPIIAWVHDMSHTLKFGITHTQSIIK